MSDVSRGQSSPGAPESMVVPTRTAGPGFVPIAEPLPGLETGTGSMMDGEAGPGSQDALAPGLLAAAYSPFARPRFCSINLKEGCYRIAWTPNPFVRFHGTLRVDRSDGQTVISGDFYRYSYFTVPHVEPPLFATHRSGVEDDEGAVRGLEATTGGTVAAGSIRFKPKIPAFPRNRYYSYLRVVGVSQSPPITFGACRLTLTAEEYVYTQPPAGQFNGSFPAPPGTRTVNLVLEPKAAPYSWGGPYFEGRLYENGVDKGPITMEWISSQFRRATLEIDSVTGAVPPQPVDGRTNTEDFRTIFESAGWDLRVSYDQTNLPVPEGVSPNECWEPADLHALMLNLRSPGTDLDREWRLHLIVVPGRMGCGRGAMFDTVVVPREAVVSFSDDGFPSSESPNYGTAANRKQRDVPRAFLRSAAHQVGHGFNQIQQEQEPGADNSVMTTSPDVANLLGGPSTGAPDVFPNDVNLTFNAHVRHQLVHFPDIVVRPGGMTFGSGHISLVPEADRQYLEPEVLELELDAVNGRLELGEPLRLHWRLINRSDQPIPVPSRIGVEAQHAFIAVTDSAGREQAMPSFMVRTEAVTIRLLEPGESIEAETRVFWSSNGFAFERPGKYTVSVRIVWTADGVPLAVRRSLDVWVNYPQTAADNDAAATLLAPQVGMFVALGGSAYHLTDATQRLQKVTQAAGGGGAGSVPALRGFEGILPRPERVAAVQSALMNVPVTPPPSTQRSSRRSRTTRTP